MAKGRGTARQIGRAFSEGQRSKEADGGVEEFEDLSPGNIRRRIERSS